VKSEIREAGRDTMQRSDAEDLLGKFYSARTAGDVDSAMQLVADGIHFELVGSTDHSDVPIRTEGAAEFKKILTQLIGIFAFTNFDLLHMVVEGDHIAYHCRVNVRNPTNGKTKTTELMDFITVKDGKIARWKESCDTAMAQWMLATNPDTKLS
jgi:ketosteroid isomerase-like protein